MLDFLLPFVDVGFLVVQTAFAAVMVSTIKNQFEARASTVTLVTSLTFFAGLIALSLFQIALGLPLAATSAAGSALLWGVVAGQRVYYGKRVGDEKIAFTYSPQSWCVGDKLAHEDRRYALTRLEEVAPTQLATGGRARCWQIYGRLIDERA